MNATSLYDRIRGEFDDLFTCGVHGERVRLRTLYLYPDGDHIDLFCMAKGDVTTVTDLGETTRWLRMQTTALRRSPKQQGLIEDVCLTHGVEFYRGMLLARCGPGDPLAAIVTRVAQAALRVLDLCAPVGRPAPSSGARSE